MSKNYDSDIERRVGEDGLKDIRCLIGDGVSNQPRMINHNLRVKYIDLPFRMPQSESDNSSDWCDATVQDWLNHPSGCLAEKVARESTAVDYILFWEDKAGGSSSGNPHDYVAYAQVHWTCTCCGYSGKYDVRIADRSRQLPVPQRFWPDREAMMKEVVDVVRTTGLSTTTIDEFKMDLAEARDRVMQYAIDCFFQRC